MARNGCGIRFHRAHAAPLTQGWCCEALGLPLYVLCGMWDNVPLWFVNTAMSASHSCLPLAVITHLLRPLQKGIFLPPALFANAHLLLHKLRFAA